MLEPAASVVVVGARSAAVGAVARAGFTPFLVAENPSRAARKLAGTVFEHSLDAPDTAWVALAGSIAKQTRPVGVLAATEGSVGTAAKLRAALGLPGLDPSAALRCTDKLVMKQAVQDAGLPCADFFTGEEEPSSKTMLEALGLPFLIKERLSWGTRGVRWIRNPESVPARLKKSQMAERPVNGLEMSVESFVHDGVPVFVNFTEYMEPFWSNIVPAELPTLLDEAVRSLNQEAITALGVTRGVTHMEIFLADSGPVFGELAARPPGGRIMQLMSQAYRFDPWAAWVALELGEKPPFPETAARVAGVQLLHPGAGTIRSATGMESAEEVPGVVEVVCRLKPGQEIAARVGSGQEVGRIVAEGADRETVRRALVEAKRRIAIELDPHPKSS